MSESELEKKVDELVKDQIIEVEYSKELVEEYKKEYIMEEDGIGDDDVFPYGEQTVFNEDTIEEMLGEGVEIDENQDNQA